MTASPTMPPRRLALAAVIVAGLTAGCAFKRAAPPLPAEADLSPDRLMIFVHGYMNDHETLASLVDVFVREGVALPEEAGPTRIHAHVFDFGRFSRAGDAQNRSLEDLVVRFDAFYRSLPEHCPVCRRRAGRPVEVTLVGHSLGGLLIRDFLVHERLGRPPEDAPWRIARVVTLGTPFFGSTKTRFTQGFLSVVINGVVRTVVLGFVTPERAGAFGNSLDPQARALRIGSPYLWEGHARWRRHLETTETPLPPWLHVIGIGGHLGDGIASVASANVAPLLPEDTLQTVLLDLRHGQLVRMRSRGRIGREQGRLIDAISTFMARGTLAGDRSWSWLELPKAHGGFFVPGTKAGDETSMADEATRDARLRRAAEADVADVWLRFYARVPDPAGDRPPRAVVLPAPPSYFRTGVERSPPFLDLEALPEPTADGELVPVVTALALKDSQIVAIPDLTPTGPHRLHVRLAGDVVLGAEHVRIVGNLDEAAPPPPVDGRPGIAVHVRPLQANLLHVILDEAAIRRDFPFVEDLAPVEVALVPDG